MEKITLGILAHVDAGKTTLIESMLYESHQIKKQGRVDHQDAFLDYDPQERERGITIFAKQAKFKWKDHEIFVIDTPGHVDFSASMEQVLSVLDVAIVLISAQDGIQSHTETIWKCLKEYEIPTLIFVNKMDIAYRNKEEILEEVVSKLDPNSIDQADKDREEMIAMCEDKALEEYLQQGSLSSETIQRLFLTRRFFPTFFGSALKNEGVDPLLDSLCALVGQKEFSQEFGARIFKIQEDGSALAKITGGTLKAKEIVNEIKIDQIRSFNGQKYTLLQEANAGDIVALKADTDWKVGDGLGYETAQQERLLASFLTYELLLPEEVDALQLWPYCQQLAKEDPSLQLDYHERSKKITLRLRGDVQKEVLQKMILEKTGILIGFSQGSVVYKETIGKQEYGVGHFEPLRHYAEVHVLLDPLPAGSGVVVRNGNRIESLSLGWQQQIMNALNQRQYGVLTGSELTDVQITLIAGQGNLKHTSAADFRQAAHRAVRQALRKGKSILLEPYYTFKIEVPSQSLSKVLYELEQRNASFEILETEEDMSTIQGSGAIRLLMNFQSELSALSKGRGKIAFIKSVYAPSQDTESIVKTIQYDPEADLKYPTGSIFCKQGAGYYVPYDEVEEKMHLHPLDTESSHSYERVRYHVSDEEAKRAFERTLSKKKEKPKAKKPKVKQELDHEEIKIQPKKPELLVIDGYNMIYSWNSLKDLAKADYNAARERLIDQIVNYQGYKDIDVYLVFDAYRRKQGEGRNETRHKTKIIYTRYGENADSYIERLVHDLKSHYSISVATSDGLIQNSILASGANRISARELEGKVMGVNAIALSHLK
ncbi:NYN domain-containing protein [Dubosiella newyorkensis]|uniref:NYN domain-containing protein n=1 Tax=Dubosiella newyorkensis TaxID=1862672 RepID=UPI00272BABB8|nr:NYN domain-containing protein [Dubosiella newyorkensis]